VGRAPVRALPSLSLSTLVAFLVAVAAFLAKDIPHRAFLAGLATFAGLAGLRSAFAQNVASHFGGPGQFACALTTLVALLVRAPRLLLARPRAASYLRTLLATGLFCVSWWHAAVTIRFLRYPDSVPVDTREGQVFVSLERRDFLVAVGRISTRGERVLVLPESHAIDALFRLRDVSPLPWALPGWLDERIEAELLRRLEHSPP